MSEKTYKLFNLAENQLKTAVMLFITGGDKFSVITLAGAADVIFSELVVKTGKENFTEIILKKENDKRKRQEVGREINDTLCINALKHFDPDEDEYVSLDTEGCALGAILKALANYNVLEEKNEALIIGFHSWIQANIDLKKYQIDQ